MYDKKPTVLGPEQEVIYKIDLIAVFDILVSKSEDFIFNPYMCSLQSNCLASFHKSLKTQC